jgi:hypothetical protein
MILFIFVLLEAVGGVTYALTVSIFAGLHVLDDVISAFAQIVNSRAQSHDAVFPHRLTLGELSARSQMVEHDVVLRCVHYSFLAFSR